MTLWCYEAPCGLRSEKTWTVKPKIESANLVRPGAARYQVGTFNDDLPEGDHLGEMNGLSMMQ